MDSSRPNSQRSFLLPRLDPAVASLSAERDGEWTVGPFSFIDIANSLEVKNVYDNRPGVDSIPSPWARPLLVDMALRDEDHPLHANIVTQWRGMLSGIALADIRGLSLRAHLIDISLGDSDLFLESLRRMIPDEDDYEHRSIYQISGGLNPWKKTFVFTLNNQIVGMSSPRSIVCPSVDGEWPGIGWFGERSWKHIVPERHLNQYERVQLRLWLHNLREKLTGDCIPIKKQLTLFLELLYIPDSQQESQKLFYSDMNFFDSEIDIGEVLRSINHPVAAERKDRSDLEIMVEGRRTGLVLLPDREKLSKLWSMSAHEIYLGNGSRLHNCGDLNGLDILFEKDIFLEKLYFLENVAEDKSPIPGAMNNASVVIELSNYEYGITIILPINSLILRNISPEELLSMTEVGRIQKEGVELIYIEIKFKLCGNPDAPYVVHKEYAIFDKHCIENIPVLDLWPFMVSKGWEEYFAYFDIDPSSSESNSLDIDVLFPYSHSFTLWGKSTRKIHKMSSFPRFVVLQDQKENTLGVILLPPPPDVDTPDPDTWTVGVDFGTSFTNIFYKSHSTSYIGKMEITFLHHQVFDPGDDKRNFRLREFFMPVPPPSKDRDGYSLDGLIGIETFPLSTVLTRQGASDDSFKRIIVDGRIYFPPKDFVAFNPRARYLECSLKWSINSEVTKLNYLFMSHLVLLVSAEAKLKGASKIRWVISYPSSFSRNEQQDYVQRWKELLIDNQIGTKTGIKNIFEEESLFSESLSSAIYFARAEENMDDLNGYICIDMGGGSSDICMWVRGRPVYQCSVRLANRDIFAQFIRLYEDYFSQQFALSLDLEEIHISERQHETDFTEKDELDSSFYIKLDAQLLHYGDKLMSRRIREMSDHPQFKNITLFTMFGLCGLFYYLGMVLRGLSRKNLYPENKLPIVRVGGNGSRLFNWLSSSGFFDDSCTEVNRLLTEMIVKGSDFSVSDAKLDTRLSKRPKSEVAWGLVQGKNLSIWSEINKDFTIFPGEECRCVGDDGSSFLVGPYDLLNLEGVINDFSVVDIGNLRTFVSLFNQAVIDMKLQKFRPIHTIADVSEEEFYEALFLRASQRLDSDLRKNMVGPADSIRLEPPFVLGVKAILRSLGIDDQIIKMYKKHKKML